MRNNIDTWNYLLEDQDSHLYSIDPDKDLHDKAYYHIFGYLPKDTWGDDDWDDDDD